MSDEFGIQFGDVEQAPPAVRLRPDSNKHFAVAPVFEPQADELPIFVDLDALIDMEEHALSDTRVELGGVMLGGQYEDSAGRPFVVVSDALRAQHYESTKGSFKFTHDTWSQITRERDEFPEELQMVGWYHTHPDWGVFLSGMDLFICENFFNKPLDVALVIDPCRQDRGFFQWTSGRAERTRRTGGFYLMASRFRQTELEAFAAYLEGQSAMSADPRLRNLGSSSAPVINVGGNPQPSQTIAVLGLLALQFCFLALLAWRILLPPEPAEESVSAKELTSLHESIAELSQVQQQRAEIDTKLEVLDEVFSQQDGAPARLVTSLAAKTDEAKELRNNLRAQAVLLEKLDADIQELKNEQTNREGRIKSLEASINRYKESVDARDERIGELKERLAAFEDSASGEAAKDSEAAAASTPRWQWIAGASVVILVVLAVAAYLIPKKEAAEAKAEGSS